MSVGATGVAEYSMAARDAMIAILRQCPPPYQHLSKEESVKVVEFAQGLGAHVTAEWHLNTFPENRKSALD